MLCVKNFSSFRRWASWIASANSHCHWQNYGYCHARQYSNVFRISFTLGPLDRSFSAIHSLTHARTHTLKPIKTFNTEHSAIVCFHTNSLFCAIYYLHISCMFAHFVLHFAFLPSIQQSRLWYEGVRERERKNRIESNLPIRRYCLDSHESRRQQQTETKKNSLNSILNTYTKMAKVVKQTITRHFFLLV